VCLLSSCRMPYSSIRLRMGTNNTARRGYTRRRTSSRIVSSPLEGKLTDSIPPPNASTRTNASTTTTKSVNLAAPVFVPKTSAGTFTPRVNSPDPGSLALPPAGPRADAPEWPQLNTSQGLGASVCPLSLFLSSLSPIPICSIDSYLLAKMSPQPQLTYR
jgi:hypothetical protein